MDTNELNQAVHEAMGKCWHDVEYDECGGGKCRVCGSIDFGPFHGDDNPDYCSEDTPRRYLNELEVFVIEKVGTWEYADALQRQFDMSICSLAKFATASALQRVRACAKALGIEEG